MIAGMDEAGRGPAIGPIVFGLVIVTEDQQHQLKEIGIDDSKKLSKSNRENYARKIKEIATVANTHHIPAHTIDKLREKQTMNEIEVQGFRQLLEPKKSQVSTLQLDAADVDAERFGNQFQDLIEGKIDSKHKGDQLFISVAAASIIAKVKRDNIVEEYQSKMRNLHPELPEFGAGYPKQAKPFLTAYVDKFQELPKFARKKWKTCIDVMEDFKQQQLSLDEFL